MPLGTLAKSFGVVVCWLMLVASLVGCATAPDPAVDREAYEEFRALNDPLEPFNRGVYEFNRGVDALFLKPAAGWYRTLTPPPIQKGVANFLRNLRSPVIVVNDLLQGEWALAGNTAGRFLINTTLGVAGVWDPATEWFDIPHHDSDFGQTLGIWGVGEGPFLMLPILGPSNPRDALGLAVDSAVFDPFGYFSLWLADDQTLQLLARVRLAMTIIDARSQNWDALEDIERTSLDPYATLRSLYRQFRARRIGRGWPDTLPDIPSFEDFPDIPDQEAVPDVPGQERPSP